MPEEEEGRMRGDMVASGGRVMEPDTTPVREDEGEGSGGGRTSVLRGESGRIPSPIPVVVVVGVSSSVSSSVIRVGIRRSVGV